MSAPRNLQKNLIDSSQGDSKQIILVSKSSLFGIKNINYYISNYLIRAQLLEDKSKDKSMGGSALEVPWEEMERYVARISSLISSGFESTLIELNIEIDNPFRGKSSKELNEFLDKCDLFQKEFSQKEFWTQENILQYINEIPGLNKLINDPFLFPMILQTLPHFYAQHKLLGLNLYITEASLLDEYFDIIFLQEVDRFWIENDCCLPDSPFTNFKSAVWQYAMDLADMMHRQNLTVVTSEKNKDIWDQFFKESKDEEPWRRVARQICLQCILESPKEGTYTFRENSENLITYFVAKKSFELMKKEFPTWKMI